MFTTQTCRRGSGEYGRRIIGRFSKGKIMTDLNEAQNEPETIQTLDSIFEGDDLAENVTEEQVEAEPEVTEEVNETTGETEEEAQAETEETEPPSDKEEQTVPLAALTDLRRKLREKDEELKQYKQPEQVVELPDPVEDPDGYKEAIKVQLEHERLTEIINKSRDKMLDEVNDYEEKEVIFKAMRDTNPELQKELLQSPDPAKFAYDKASEYIQSLAPKAEPVKDVEVEDPKPKKSASEVPNLTKATASGKNNAQTETRMTLDDVLPD